MDAFIFYARVATVCCIIRLGYSGFAPANGSSVHWYLNGSRLAFGGAAHHQRNFPLYMMQLYRSYRAADHESTGTTDEASRLRQADSVVSLTAKGKNFIIVPIVPTCLSIFNVTMLIFWCISGMTVGHFFVQCENDQSHVGQ